MLHSSLRLERRVTRRLSFTPSEPRCKAMLVAFTVPKLGRSETLMGTSGVHLGYILREASASRRR